MMIQKEDGFNSSGNRIDIVRWQKKRFDGGGSRSSAENFECALAV
jgi:hypothetical protein